MAERSDIHAELNYSPRRIIIEDPSTELTQQDLVDTLRGVIEPSWDAIDDPFLHSSAGKENLGGGVNVGITVTLQNALVAFESVTTAASIGTATSIDTNGTLLTDTGATFETDGITPGDCIINFLDQSISTVIEVLSQTQIQHYKLDGGVNNDWEIGDNYKIYHIKQCIISGGNLTAVDDQGDPLPSPISPTAFTQIVLTSSASATLQELEDIQYAAFGGYVWIDVINGYSGIYHDGKPVGTPQLPSNNLTDAKAIAIERGFRRFYIIGDLILGATDNVNGYIIKGGAPNKVTITCVDGCLTNDTEFQECKITGDLGTGDKDFIDCFLNDITRMEGLAQRCMLFGTIQINGEVDVNFIDCYGGGEGPNIPILDMNNDTCDVAFKNYSGTLKVINASQNQNSSFDLVSGHIIFENTVTNINAVVRGNGKVTNNSIGGTIDTSILMQPEIAFEGAVRIDTSSSFTGTIFPIGTPQKPVNNLADATIIANNYNIKSFNFRGQLTLMQTYAGYSFVGSGSSIENSIDMNSQNVSGCKFSYLTLTGTQIGFMIECLDVYVYNVTGINATLKDGALTGNIVLGDPGSMLLGAEVGINSDCVIDMVGDGRVVNLSGFGDVIISNLTGTSVINFGFKYGGLTLNSSCNGGILSVDGKGKLINNSSSPGTYVFQNRLMNEESIADQVLDEQLSEHEEEGSFGASLELIKNTETGRWELINNQMIIYKPDNITEICRFNLFDKDGNPAMENVYKREKV